jgi:hypothetical protein
MRMGVDELELLAASLRADARDLDAFVEALATKLEAAFPDRVEVERRGALFGGRKRVVRVRATLGDDHFELERGQSRVSCRRRKIVRGITLKNENLTIDEWIDGFSKALLAEASASQRGRESLARLLQ